MKTLTEVLDNAISTGAQGFDIEHIARYPSVRQAAYTAVETYSGTSRFMQSLLAQHCDKPYTLTDKQMRVALNIALTDERCLRAEEATERALENVAVSGNDYEPRYLYEKPDPCYMDLRSKAQKLADEAKAAFPEPPTMARQQIPNGIYTVVRDEGHITFRVKDAPAKFKLPEGAQLLEYLSGSDNEESYTGCASIVGSELRMWSRFKANGQLAADAAKLMTTPMDAARAYVLASGRCFVCGRTLTTPQSIKLGIGPICLEKIEGLGFKWVLPDGTPTNETYTQAERAAKSAARMDELFA